MSQPKRILLVEDDDALANVYITRLQAEGFDARRVNNGEEALAAALNYHPDMVLLDVMMPKVSGFDVLDILRTHARNSQTQDNYAHCAKPGKRQRTRQIYGRG